MAHPRSSVAGSGPIGGASGDAGVEYRRAVAAYAVAHALAGEALSGFGFALRLARVAAVAVETDEHADDVRVTLVGGYKAQVQAKRTLSFGPVMNKAVSQWTAAARSGLDPVRDRLVLVSGVASGPVHVLGQALERCKTDEPGAFTAAEGRELERLDQMLSGLTSVQRELVRRCAVISVVDVEDEQSPGAAYARLLLGRVVGGGDVAVNAWRDLVAHCGRVGRLRGGFGVEGWVRLLQEDGYRVTGSATPAADAARQAEALDRYRDCLRSRGTMVDLRPLGADTAPVPLDEMDASAECVPAGADRRDAEPLAWSLLRRRRVLLTGLPGGGKSVAVAAAAAVLADAAGAPLPLVVSLRDVDARDRSFGFADRVLDTAVKDVPAIDRALVREVLERGLESGATALLLDSLDETHDRRGAVVSEIGDLCAGVSADVPVLVATRDVAYAQAITLGWDDVRLAAPQKPERAIRAVLAAVAAARHVENRDAWLERRVDWVREVLDRDRAVGETVLMPVLLALLAADQRDGALPATRAEILHAGIEAAVRRREALRDPGLRIATLAPHDAAEATLAAFATEAGVLGDFGGQAAGATVREAIASMLTHDWGLPPGAAVSGSRAIVHFWDELGIFVIRADETVAPRMEVFLDIGDAVQASAQSPDAVATWVEARIRDRRHEPLLLAAGLSHVACERLLAAACDSGQRDLLFAAGNAVRQGASVSREDRERLIGALSADAANPDKQGWASYALLLDVVGEHRTGRTLNELLAQYPAEYHVIADAAVALRTSPALVDDQVLLEALRVHKLPRLPDRQSGAASPRRWPIMDALHSEVLEAAARNLLGRSEEATGLVVDLLTNVSMGLHERLLEALRAADLIDAASDVIASLSDKFARSMAWFKDFDSDGPARFIDHLAQRPRAELTPGQSAQLDELAAFYQTLGLDAIGAWPRRHQYASWLEFTDVVEALGGFDSERIAAEADVMRQRVARFGTKAFSALDIASEPRDPDQWHDIEDPEAAARVLGEALFMGALTTEVAAFALTGAPLAIAVPMLEEALQRLNSSRSHQHPVAYSLAWLKDDEPLAGWATSDNPTLRLVAAQRLPDTLDGELNPLLCQLTNDIDRSVADAAVRSVANAGNKATEQLRQVADAQHKEWNCLHCGSLNQGVVRGCTECHILPPEPAKTARDLLAELSE